MSVSVENGRRTSKCQPHRLNLLAVALSLVLVAAASAAVQPAGDTERDSSEERSVMGEFSLFGFGFDHTGKNYDFMRGSFVLKKPRMGLGFTLVQWYRPSQVAGADPYDLRDYTLLTLFSIRAYWVPVTWKALGIGGLHLYVETWPLSQVFEFMDMAQFDVLNAGLEVNPTGSLCSFVLGYRRTVVPECDRMLEPGWYDDKLGIYHPGYSAHYPSFDQSVFAVGMRFYLGAWFD